MTKQVVDTDSINADDSQVASILNKIIWACWGTYFLVIITGFFFNDWTLVTVTLIGSVFLVLPYIFIRRGYVQISSLIVVIIILGTVTYIAVVGQGIRDLAILTFPIILIFAGLTLKRSLFWKCFGLTLVAITGLVLGEINGWFVPRPFVGSASTWFYLVGVTILLFVAAFAVDILVSNYRKNFDNAKDEIVRRKQVEEEVKKSERRFHAMIEHGRDNISLIAADSTLIWENPSAYSALGYDLNQHIGHNIFELIHPEDQDWTRNMFIQVSKMPGKYLEGEVRLMHSDGTWRWIVCTATNLLDELSVLAIVLNYRDITERKEAQVAVLESETRYKALFEHSPVALWEEDFSQVVVGINEIGLQSDFLRQYLESHPELVINLMSKIVINDVNKATMQIFGYEDKKLLIGNSSNLFKNVSHEALVEELMAISTRQTNHEIIVDNCRSDGKVINVKVSWSIYPGHEADMSKVIVNTVDITQQIQAIGVQSAIYRISQAASATENLQELYKSIHSILAELMPAKNFYIALYDGDEGMISFPYHVDEMDPHPEPRKFGNGWSEFVIRSGQPVLLSPENVLGLEEEMGVTQVGSNSIDWLGVPLKVEDRIIGMVAVQTYSEGVRYTAVEKEILVFVSNQIAMAIDRKRIEEKLKYSSNHDPLTGLYNRGYYEEEIKRLSSGRQFPVGVIMMDIDGLKVINDKYGHAAGDELLKSFASVLQKEFRSNDVVARIGGDEFSVLLPLSPIKIVKKAVERTQKSIDRFNELNPKIHLSFSVGYFTTESGDSILDTIKHTDALMYHDKTSKKASRLV